MEAQVPQLTHELKESTAQADTWGVENGLGGVHDAMMRHDREAAREFHAQATTAFQQASLPQDVAEILHYRLLFNGYYIEWLPPTDYWTKANYLVALEDFTIPAKTRAGNFERLRHLLAIRVNACRDGFDEMTHDELMGYIDSLEGYPHRQIWFYVSRWAFDNNDIELMERAFENRTFDPPIIMGQAHWQRVNVMYQIMTGRVSKRDVLETLNVMEILPQLFEFRKDLLPHFEKAGLVDDEVLELIAELEEFIKANKPPQHYEKRTKRVNRA